MIQFFSLSAPREKLSHIDLKSWVTGEIKIRLNFLGQNDSIFSLSAPEQKIESLILTLKVESLAELKFDPIF